jgi:hypothetical protein
MTIGFSNVTPPVSITDSSIASFTAQSAGTFSATIVPEPTTFGMGCMSVVLVSLAVSYDRRLRRKVAKV